MKLHTDRRTHCRYALPSMYTQVSVRRLHEQSFILSGHAYDISEGGMRFELDTPLQPGERVAIHVDLPTGPNSPISDRRGVYAMGNVIWVNEDDLESQGPVRIACVFSNFCRADDAERLNRMLNSGRFALAA